MKILDIILNLKDNLNNPSEVDTPNKDLIFKVSKDKVRNSYFDSGHSTFLRSDPCYTKAWNINCPYGPKLTNHGSITFFLGLFGLTYDNANSLSKKEFTIILNKAIDIATLLEI